MKKAAAWSVRGVEQTTQEIVEEAARRAGMSLGDWLDEVVAERAAEQGVSPEDLGEDDKLDAIGDRLSRLSARDAGRPSREERAGASDTKPRASVEEARLAQERLDAAIAKFEARAARNEERTAKAFESVATWIERSQADRIAERETLRTVAEKLAEIESRSARQADSPRAVSSVKPSRGERGETDIDARLEELARRVASPDRKSSAPGQKLERPTFDLREAAARIASPKSESADRPDAPSRGERPRIDIREAVEQIARRQAQTLQGPSAPQATEAPPRSGWRNFGVDADTSVSRAPEATSASEVAAPAAGVSRAPAESLRQEIAALDAQLSRLRAAQSGRRPASTSAEDLRAGLASMSRSVADIAPRNAAVALEGAVGDLGKRLSEARREGASEQLVAPLETMIQQVLEALRARDPHSAAEGLERELRALGAKVDALAAASVNPEILERIRRQTDEVRALLAAAAMNPVPVERLERQIGDLADRVERLATNPAPHAEIAQVLRSLSDAHAQIEQSTPAAVLNSIERRLEELAARMDDAAQHPTPAIDPRPVEDLARRVEDVRALIERQAGARPDGAAIEAALRDINAKLDRAPDSAADSKALMATLQGLNDRLDETFRQPRTANIDPRPIEELARRIEGVRATVERQADFGTHAAKMEAALGDISSKLDRAPDGAADSKALMATLHALSARLEENFRQPRTANIDPRPIEDLARRIEGVRATVERQADFGTHAAKLEAALGDISSKLDRPPTPPADSKVLNNTLQDLTAKLEEAFRRPTPPVSLDPRPLDDLARRIDAVRASVENQADQRFDPSGLEATLRDISAKLDHHAVSTEDSRALIGVIRELSARLDNSAPQTLDTAPLEAILRNLSERHIEIDTAPFESLLRDVSAKLDRHAVSAEDSRALIEVIRELSARLESAATQTLDMAPLEAALRNLSERPIEIDTGPFETLLRDLSAKISVPPPAVSVDIAPIERLLNQVDAKLDAAARPAVDPRSLELAFQELHDKLDDRPDPQIDARLVEQAADMLARRLEQRGGPALDMDALVNHISEIHGRLDAVNITSASNAALERLVAELIEELETTRQVLQSAAVQPSAIAPLIGGIAELREEQAISDRRLESRLSGVHDILEKLADRLTRIEDEAESDDDTTEPRRPAPNFAPTTPGGVNVDDANLRDIPDRPTSATQRAATSRPMSSLDGSNFLLEPGSTAPARTRDAQAGTAPSTRNSAINAHIAAARRAAQAAMAESKVTDDALSSLLGPPTSDDFEPSAMERAQAFLARRRRPILLGATAAVLTVAAAVTVVELRNGRPQPVQKSELTAPARNPAPSASSRDAETGAKTATVIDDTPTGALAATAAKPTTSSSVSATPAPSDLIAALPADLPAPLRGAAAAGDFGAEAEIALRYLEGRSVPRDTKIASRWIELAAIQGLPIAQYRLGALYEKGTGVTRDLPLARSWYLKAANAGNARAMYNLAVISAEDAGTGKPDYSEAAQWFRRAGELGIRDSQFNLGVLYGRGLGVAQDLGQSWMWFSLAARQGDTDAAKKRDEVAAKLDAATLATASKALAEFKTRTPSPWANEIPAPAGGWDGNASAPQAVRPSPPAAPGAPEDAHG